jgi:hypothetical protein
MSDLSALRNPKDPLHNNYEGPKELFERFAKAANGFPGELVVDAAANVLINAIRQAQPMQRGALNVFDELVTKARTVLAEHYAGTGERKNIFPFHQVIKPERFDARPKF